MIGDDDALHRELLDGIAQGVSVWELANADDAQSLRLVYANRATLEQLDTNAECTLGKSFSEVLPEASHAQLLALAAVCRDHRSRDLGPFVSRRGALAIESLLQLHATPLRGARAMVTLENPSATSSLNRFLDSIIEHIPAMVFIKDAQHLRFERFNRAGEQLLGRSSSEMIGKTDYDFFPKEQADFFVNKDRSVLAGKTLVTIDEEPIDTPDGRRWLHTQKIPLLDDRGRAAHLLGISLDITERKRAEEILRTSHEELEQRVQRRTAELQRQIDERKRAEQALARTEEQLRQTQKMEAIGRLAGGIAHDFNNLLSVVLTYCEVLLPKFPTEGSARAGLTEIHRAAQRAADLTRQLLAFSRQQVLQPRVLDLNDLLGNMQQMLSRLVGEDIDLVLRCSHDLSHVRADPNQIEQVVMNLVVNARDAMPTGGKLIIETANVRLDGPDAAAQLGAKAGPHVMIAVSDTGVGMDKDTMAHIFEPFFTTKEKGKGTGLGLSMVFGSVRQSGGSIAVQSEPGKGAVFRLYLPESEDCDGIASERPPDKLQTLDGTETILVVEDEEPVRVIVADVLRAHGYKVLAAGRPSHAMTMQAAHRGVIDLLLTDVVMPEMGGRALAEQLSTLRPQMRVMFMSGYTDDAVVRHGAFEAGVTFIQKPLTPSLLLVRVRQALDSEEPSWPQAKATTAKR